MNPCERGARARRRLALAAGVLRPAASLPAVLQVFKKLTGSCRARPSASAYGAQLLERGSVVPIRRSREHTGK